MIVAIGRKAAGDGPSSIRWIVKFGARDGVPVRATSRDKYLTVGQQCRAVNLARGNKTAGHGPGPACWIVKFRACDVATAVPAAGHEYLAITQQRCRM